MRTIVIELTTDDLEMLYAAVFRCKKAALSDKERDNFRDLQNRLHEATRRAEQAFRVESVEVELVPKK
jgi:hypothetical protein